MTASRERIVIKFGGSVLQDDVLLRAICAEMVQLQKAGTELVVIHGGGPAINEELRRRGIEWYFVEGLRVTTPEMMDVIETVLCGRVNKRIVRGLYSAGTEAVGLSGSDCGMLICRQADPRLGQVGAIEDVQTTLIESVLKTETASGHPPIPVIAPIGIGADGSGFNVNADWAASETASALKVKTLVFLTDQDGIYDADRNRIPKIDELGLNRLIQTEVVKDGMLTKTKSILNALKNGVETVAVVNARTDRPLSRALINDDTSGTVCRLTNDSGITLQTTSVFTTA